MRGWLQSKPHVRRSASVVLALLASVALVSCTSSVSGIDTAAQSVQPQFAGAPVPDSAPAPSAQGSAPATSAAETKPIQTALADTATTAPVAPNAQDAATIDSQAQLTAAASGTTAGEPLPAPAQPGVAAEGQQVTASSQETLAAPAPLVVVNQPIPIEADKPAANAQVADTALAAGAANAATIDPNSARVASASASPSLTSAEQPVKAVANKPKKTLFAAMFGDSKQKTGQSLAAETELAAPETTELALAAAPVARPNVAKAAATEAVSPEDDASQLRLTQASLSATPLEEPASAPSVDNGDLPGVRKGALFEIKRRDSLDSDADVDIGETDGGPVLLASAGGFARLAPNGLKVQRQSVDVACLKPQLVRMLKKIEAHYNTSVVVTSGYRSPNYNRRVRGAKNSLHMYCAAADIQVVGVGKWELARYLRSMPGRGGVGTYCHTESVHVDIGPDRDWNWRCSRRK